MTARTIIRLFFLALLPLLFIQLLVAKRYGEPYPAVMFPGFGQVMPADELYPYRFERMRVYAHTATDTLPVTLKELFAPFPDAYPEDALLAPLRNRLRDVADQLSPTLGSPEERELLAYLRHQVRGQLGPNVVRLELAFYQYEAEPDGSVALVDIADRKVFYFR